MRLNKRPYQGEPSNLSSFFGRRKDSNQSITSKSPMMDENVAKSFDDQMQLITPEKKKREQDSLAQEFPEVDYDNIESD